CTALAGWDRRVDLDSKGAYLFLSFWEKVRRKPNLWAVAFDASDPVNTPRDLVTDGAQGDALLAALAEAAREIEAAGFALDAPWGEIQYAPRGEERIAIHGGPGTAGILNLQRSRPNDSGISPVHGSSYIQLVGFDDDGPVADAILSYSQSTDPASPHYGDQTRAYSAKQWHRLPFTPEQIAAAQIGETVRISE
ncbi:penicillin acylase family protein, partial [Altererythrobacter sp.]|nr:penicillin acylase family protein [Altererythrobacter sp.]